MGVVTLLLEGDEYPVSMMQRGGVTLVVRSEEGDQV